MTRSFIAVIISTCTLAGCSSGTAPADATAKVEHDCTAATECSACPSCFDECLCGGGTASRCSALCSSPAAPAADAGPLSGAADAGPPAGVPATFVADGFDIPPGGETFRCQDFDNPFGRDVAVISSEAFMTVGSHHMFLFVTTESKHGSLVECNGLSFGPNVHASQQSQSRIDYPKGIGRFVSGGSGFQLMVHYLNSSTDVIHAAVATTLHTTDPANVPILASGIFANTLSIDIPAHSKATVKHSCGIPKDVHLMGASSHMHSHGVHFVARTSDGQLLYETNQWAEPEPWNFDPPRLLRGGSTIDVSCDYDNQTGSALSFGESAATNEMCIFTGLYYPASPGEEIDCLF